METIKRPLNQLLVDASRDEEFYVVIRLFSVMIESHELRFVLNLCSTEIDILNVVAVS